MFEEQTSSISMYYKQNSHLISLWSVFLFSPVEKVFPIPRTWGYFQWLIAFSFHIKSHNSNGNDCCVKVIRYQSCFLSLFVYSKNTEWNAEVYPFLLVQNSFFSLTWTSLSSTTKYQKLNNLERKRKEIYFSLQLWRPKLALSVARLLIGTLMIENWQAQLT